MARNVRSDAMPMYSKTVLNSRTCFQDGDPHCGAARIQRGLSRTVLNICDFVMVSKEKKNYKKFNNIKFLLDP